MSLVWENLKHFYQRRGLWVVYLMLVAIGLGCSASLFDHKRVALGQGMFVYPAALMYGLGCLIGTVVMEVWARPMAFCLPGHQRVTLRVLYGACIFWVSASLVALLWYPAHPPMFRSAFALAFLSLNLAAFWMGVKTAHHSGVWLGFSPLLLLLLTLVDIHVALERVMMDLYGVMLLCGLSWTLTIWVIRRLQQRQAIRDIASKLWTSLFDSFSPRRIQSIAKRRQVLAKKETHSHIEDPMNQWFCRQMTQQRFGISRHVWAVWYQTVGPFVIRWKSILLFCVVLVLYLGYASFDSAPLMVLVLCLALGQKGTEPSSLLKTEGRRQRFFNIALGTLSSQGLAIVLILGMILASRGLAFALPAVTIGGHLFSFHAINPWTWIIPAVAIPVIAGVGLFFLRNRVVYMCLFMAMVLIIPWGRNLGRLLVNHDSVAGSPGMAPAVITFLILLSWLVFYLCSHWHCFKRDMR